MPALTTTASDNTICSSCMNELEEMALRCKNCHCYIHLRCSNLPEYMLVRLMNTQNSFSCNKCVRTKEMPEEKYDEDFGKVQALMAKEESLITHLNREAEDTFLDSNSELLPNNVIENQSVISVTPDGNQTLLNNSTITIMENRIVNTAAPLPPNVPTGELDGQNVRETPLPNKPTCKFYLRRCCKHGRKGEACKFDHPKLCFKYIQHGDKRNGCKNGNKCNFVHPKLCDSYKSGRCAREKCNSYHIKGTKFREPDVNEVDRIGHHASHERNSTSSNNRRTPEQPMRILQRPLGTREKGSNQEEIQARPQVDPIDFLEVKSQLKFIQEQLQLLLVGRPQPLDRAIPRSSVWGNH